MLFGLKRVKDPIMKMQGLPASELFRTTEPRGIPFYGCNQGCPDGYCYISWLNSKVPMLWPYPKLGGLGTCTSHYNYK